MARPLRLQFEEAVYHITARGNRKEKIFLLRRDHEVFIDKLNETFEKYSFICYAFCLMRNHYHLVIKTPRPNLSEGMHYLNASYANWFRAKHRVVGVIFQGRYKSILVDEDRYALAVTSYVHINPTRAGFVENVEEYEWSSYPDYIGVRNPLVDRLDPAFILGNFSQSPEKARDDYKRYILEHSNMENPLRDAQNGIAVGSEEYLERIKRKIRAIGKKREIRESKIRDVLSPQEIIQSMISTFQIGQEEIYKKQRGNYFRQLALFLMKHYTDLSLREIGNMFSVDYTAVSMAVKRFGERLEKDHDLMVAKSKITRALDNQLCEM